MTVVGGVGLAVAAVVAASVGALLWVRRRWMIVTVDGPSMMPTLVAGDRIRARRVPPATVQTGDVVVALRPAPGPRRLMVKRVAAAPGEPTPPRIGPEQAAPGAPVPTGSYVLLGDNPANSYDSRVFGYVPAEHILAVARSRFTPRTSPSPGPSGRAPRAG